MTSKPAKEDRVATMLLVYKTKRTCSGTFVSAGSGTLELTVPRRWRTVMVTHAMVVLVCGHRLGAFAFASLEDMAHPACHVRYFLCFHFISE